MNLPAEFKDIFLHKNKSYKMGLFLSFLDEIQGDIHHLVPIDRLRLRFLQFYQQRELSGEPVDELPPSLRKQRWSEVNEKEIRSLIQTPLDALKDVLSHNKSKQIVQFHSSVLDKLDQQTLENLRNYALDELDKYFLRDEQQTKKDQVMNPSPLYSDQQIIDHIDSYIASKGFYYDKSEIINLYLSLKTKPFVILSGISGTGKTKIVQRFAESLGATEKNGQFTLIPVRPDWSDGSDLIGYTDIKGDFQIGRLTKVLLEALKHPDRPYFVLLDEMNLARVEYYFSDLLSVMESREWSESKIVTLPVLDEPIDGVNVTIPPNVFFIGTVNMDETTHPFSKKVLDRANTIEFNEVKLDYLAYLNTQEDVELEPLEVHADQFVSKYLNLKDVFTNHESLVRRTTEKLVQINHSLERIGAHVGYRVRDEICFYMAYNAEANLMDEEKALDRQWMQKILPRISGSDSGVFHVLSELFKIFSGIELTEDQDDKPDLQQAKYPRSAEKVFEMRRRYMSDGFTSYWL